MIICFRKNAADRSAVSAALSGGGAVAPVCFALRACYAPFTRLVFLAPEWLRGELLCPFAEERAPARRGTRGSKVAKEVQRARIVTKVRIAEQ